MNKISVLGFIILIVTGCSANKTNKVPVSYIDSKQVPLFDKTEGNIKINAPDSVFVGEQYCADIILINETQKLINAYVGSHPSRPCDFSKSLVDTSKHALDNCNIKLNIKGDTATFCIKSPVPDDKINFKFAVLTRDKNEIYHMDTFHINIKVTVKMQQ